MSPLTPVVLNEQWAYSIHIMHSYTIPSTFFGETTIFHYPAKKETNRAILILKGLYGEHIPSGINNKQSWDNQLVDALKVEYNLFLIKTGRYNTNDKKKAFVGKTYQQECDDIQHAFKFCQEKISKHNFHWGSVAMSFGGTTLIGCPDILNTMLGVVMISSGSGRSPTTTKPLLSTLPDTIDLLKPISEFKGLLYFLHGGQDSVVPLESQKKIYDSATKCFSRGWIEFPHLDHELSDPINGVSQITSIVKKFIPLILSE